MELYYPLVLDGATGTELQKRGYDGSVSTEQWVIEHPEAIQDLHDKYIKAGSDIVYAPTFGANRVKLEEAGIFNKVGEYNKKLVEIAKSGVRGRALIAGDMSPTGKFLAPVGDTSFEEFYDIYKEQAQALEDAGVDLFAVETMMTVPEARAAVLAIRDVSSKPIIVSFTCEKSGRTLTGSDVAAALLIFQGMGVDAFGLNCSVGPDDLLTQIKRLREYSELPLIAKPNAGMPINLDGNTRYDCPPEEFTRSIEDFAEAGVDIFGGCCGTTPEHIETISRKLADLTMVKPDPKALKGKLPAATEKDPALVDPDVELGEIYAADDSLGEKIEEANAGDAPVISVRINRTEEAEVFADFQQDIRKALCIVSDDAEALETALRLYQGRPLYAGNLPDDVLVPLAEKYGIII